MPLYLDTSAKAQLSAVYKGNVALRVRVVDGSGNMEVTVERSSDGELSLGAFLEATATTELKELPALGHGQIAKLVKGKGVEALQKRLDEFNESQITMEHNQKQKSRRAGRFVVNVAGPDGMAAFRSLINLDLTASSFNVVPFL